MDEIDWTNNGSPFNIITMRPSFEIDVTDPVRLRAAKVQLTRLLEIVDFALTKYPQSQGHPDLFAKAMENGDGDHLSPHQGKPNINYIIADLPNKFTTSNVILALGVEGKENRARAKSVLNQLVKKGSLRVITEGKGRRPTEFEKVIDGE